MLPDERLTIASRDYWFKIVDMLQQNWALTDTTETGAAVWFFDDTARVFDEMTFPSALEATKALRRNGFRRYIEDANVQGLIAVPQPPFRKRPHPNGPIYSSGTFWKLFRT